MKGKRSENTGAGRGEQRRKSEDGGKKRREEGWQGRVSKITLKGQGGWRGGRKGKEIRYGLWLFFF